MLITAAPSSTARAMPRAEAEHGILVPAGRVTFSVRAPGHRPRMPMSFLGAAATVVVAVPWASNGAPLPVDVMFEPAISGCVTSICVSTTPISGLSGVTCGGTWSRTTKSRQGANPDSGSGDGACARRLSRFGSA
jgi:hypothetical protein